MKKKKKKQHTNRLLKKKNVATVSLGTVVTIQNLGKKKVAHETKCIVQKHCTRIRAFIREIGVIKFSQNIYFQL